MTIDCRRSRSFSDRAPGKVFHENAGFPDVAREIN